tara:strand:+ start:1827 stop:2462 length:636 start_codon:yes stop_codon:yes gene_type:complete
MLKTLKLHGDLADFVGHKEFDVVINSPAEAVRFLVYNFKGVEKYMSDKYYKVVVDEQEIGEDELPYPVGKSTINIVPVIVGAGGRGFGKILLGAALIGSAFVFGSLQLGQVFGPIVQPGSLAAATGFTKAAAYLGGALVLQGVSDLLFPLPEPPDGEADPRLSFSFSGIQNTARPGTTLPVVYGEITTGSVVISASVDTNQIQVETEGTTT